MSVHSKRLPVTDFNHFEGEEIAVGSQFPVKKGKPAPKREETAAIRSLIDVHGAGDVPPPKQ